MAGPATTSTSTSSSTQRPPASPPANEPPQAFDTALRGYERRQVDEYVGEQAKEIARLTSELAEAQRQRRLANEHAEATEREIREFRARSAHAEPAVPEDGFGFRAEKLLRMAEQEATEIRTHASRESAAIIEKARTEAEKHRHEVEQNLISRASLLEQQAAQRAAELQDREQQIADQLAAAREQAEQVHAAASRAADRLRQESEAAAVEMRTRAEAAVQRQRDQAAQEIARLTTLQPDVRAELGRLAEVLTAELNGSLPAPRMAVEKPADAKHAAASTNGSPNGSGGPSGNA